ncbi:hypothetical protein ABIA25_000293 [Sinorhizobium fredii]
MTDDAFSVAEFVKIAGISKQYLYVLWSEGRGPPRCQRKVGAKPRIYLPYAPAIAWLYERYPDRARTYAQMSGLLEEPAWSPFPVTIKGVYDNEPWAKPEKVSAIHRCKGCSKAIRSTKTWCSFKCQSAYLKQAAE